MTTVREEIRNVMKDFREATEPNAIAAEFYFKLAIKSYFDAITLAPYRTRNVNVRAQEVAYEFCEKAIILGISEEKMEEPLYNLRRHWVRKLPEDEQA